MLKEYTAERQSSVVRFMGKGPNVKVILKEMFLVHGGKCLSRKAVHNVVDRFS
jgi:hypothetical protein